MTNSRNFCLLAMICLLGAGCEPGPTTNNLNNPIAVPSEKALGDQPMSQKPFNPFDIPEIHLAVEAKDLARVKAVLDRDPQQIHCDEPDTPLHAASTRSLEIVQELIARGANVNARGLNGDTPLHLAAKNGHPLIVGYLLKHGADPQLINNHGETPLQLAAFFSDESGKSGPEALIKHGVEVDCFSAIHLGMIDEFIQNGKADNNYILKSRRRRELYHGLIRRIQIYCSDISTTRLDRAAMQKAVQKHVPAIDLLIELGLDINVVDSQGYTPLAEAASLNTGFLVAYLLSRGALTNVPNSYSALQEAKKSHNREAIDLLIQAGATP